jgi:hypothetical protein
LDVETATFSCEASAANNVDHDKTGRSAYTTDLKLAVALLEQVRQLLKRHLALNHNNRIIAKCFYFSSIGTIPCSL